MTYVVTRDHDCCCDGGGDHDQLMGGDQGLGQLMRPVVTLAR